MLPSGAAQLYCAGTSANPLPSPSTRPPTKPRLVCCSATRLAGAPYGRLISESERAPRVPLLAHANSAREATGNGRVVGALRRRAGALCRGAGGSESARRLLAVGQPIAGFTLAKARALACPIAGMAGGSGGRGGAGAGPTQVPPRPNERNRPSGAAGATDGCAKSESGAEIWRAFDTRK